MNTLSRAITARIFISQSHYQSLCIHWRQLVNSDRRCELTSAHHLLYLALLGRDWRKAFTFPANQIKLANGGFAAWGLFSAWHRLHSEAYAPDLMKSFGDLVTPGMLQQIRVLLPYKLVYRFSETDYAPGKFPFEAYTIPEGWLPTQSEALDV